MHCVQMLPGLIVAANLCLDHQEEEFIVIVFLATGVAGMGRDSGNCMFLLDLCHGAEHCW